MVEKNNELLIKNHQFRPTGSAAFPEANAAFSKNYGREYNHGRGVAVAVALNVAVDAIEVVFITLHIITRSTRSIM